MTDLFVKIKGQLGNFNLNFEHNFGSEGITVIYGPNGSGKSSIISAIGGFIRNLEMSIILNGHVLEGKQKIPSYILFCFFYKLIGLLKLFSFLNLQKSDNYCI